MPLRAPERWLQDVLRDRAGWVIEKLDGWQARKPDALCWADGEDIPYLGELLTLRVVPSAKPACQNGTELWLQGAGGEAGIERRVSQWYRRQAQALFEARVAHYAPMMNVTPLVIKLSTAKTRWGSCTSNGTVRLNLQLIKLPTRLIDYVVVHELAHLREMNHSPAFWQVVEGSCPDYAKLRRELKGCSL
jgi:predicted metal-dependent hydrolase